MGRNVFFVSDTHFGHAGLVNGNLLPRRPFSSVEEMDETMIERWNEVVRPQDKVYHLGDVTMAKKRIPVVKRLRGHKTLILGNHDIYSAAEYLPYFDNLRAARVFDGFIATHIPIHSSSLERFEFNLHGHTHYNEIADPRYISTCVEQTNFYPVELSEIRLKIANRKFAIENRRTA